MYAIIKTGGKQYKVTVGQTLKIETVDAEIGAPVLFDQILALGQGASVQFGHFDQACVKATVHAQGRHPKVSIFKIIQLKVTTR